MDAALIKSAAVKASIVDFFISIPLFIVELMCWFRAPEGTHTSCIHLLTKLHTHFRHHCSHLSFQYFYFTL